VSQGSVVGIVTSYRLGSSGFKSHPALFLNVYWGFFLGAKQLGHEVDHSPPSISKVKNKWSYTPTPPQCLHGMDRDDFTFTFYPSSLFLIKIRVTSCFKWNIYFPNALLVILHRSLSVMIIYCEYTTAGCKELYTTCRCVLPILLNINNIKKGLKNY
jgi:hypothetical protein